MPPCRVGQHLQRGELVARLQRPELLLARRPLVPQLDDVDPAGQRGVGEFGQIAALAAGVGAQVQRRGREAVTGFVHTATLATTRVGVEPTRESRERGLRVGSDLPLPSHLIRVMPAKGGENATTDHWPSSAAASSACPSRAARRSTAGRSACTGADEHGASWVAGGMLAPHSEGWPGEERLLRLGLASLALWHGGFLDGLPADVVTARDRWWSPSTAPTPPT